MEDEGDRPPPATVLYRLDHPHRTHPLVASELPLTHDRVRQPTRTGSRCSWSTVEPADPSALTGRTSTVTRMKLSGFAVTFQRFLAFRFFAGLFLGGIVPAINVLVSEYASDQRRGTVMGIYGVGMPLGAAVGGFLSIFLINTFGWQGPFFFSAVTTA